MAKKKTDSAADVKDTAKETTEKTEKTKEKAKKASQKSSKKKKNNGKPGFFKRIGNWFHDLKVEFRKVTWPSKKTVANHTSVVVGSIVVWAVFIGLLDTGLLKLMELLIDLGK